MKGRGRLEIAFIVKEENGIDQGKVLWLLSLNDSSLKIIHCVVFKNFNNLKKTRHWEVLIIKVSLNVYLENTRHSK